MTGVRWFAVAAAGLLGAGIAVGAAPMSVEGVSCGSVFAASRDAQDADVGSTLFGGSGPGNLAARCSDRRADRAPLVWILAGGGAGGLLVAGMAAAARAPRRSS